MTIPPHPLVTRARQLAAEVLAPQAERVDQEVVPASSIEAVKRSGLLGVSAPVEYGGSAAPAAVARETTEILAGACCSTWFVQTQHHTPVITLANSELPVRERLLGPLAKGELLSGVAYAQLRAYPRLPVRVTREGGGWRFDGTVPWYTGWGLNDVMLLAGVTDSDEALFAFTEAREQPGLRPSPAMRLAALTASRTVSLELGGLWLPDDAVALRTPYATWAATDRPRNTNASPAVFGVTASALDLLDSPGGDPAAPSPRTSCAARSRWSAPSTGCCRTGCPRGPAHSAPTGSWPRRRPSPPAYGWCSAPGPPPSNWTPSAPRWPKRAPRPVRTACTTCSSTVGSPPRPARPVETS
ncbi:acyl-CoA dehydrogenase family protein [Streptomyces sp. NBC_00996]|uniref:acyl-CoA dehydrogenase family protein n=1 Tax=Streptomyces sp. NBC_00996 TaxID=2903710 RepID=UPI0038686407|nr:acyl-CoA dehydrogenase family protein [Streptomyces sp. NBC_00996]